MLTGSKLKLGTALFYVGCQSLGKVWKNILKIAYYGLKYVSGNALHTPLTIRESNHHSLYPTLTCQNVNQNQ